jgi:heme/copper-type cytochrome/quinol oxidase subunit 2
MSGAPTAGIVSGAARLQAQEAPASLRAFTINAKDYRFEPGRIEVMQNDLVKVTVTSGDVAYGFAIDRFRVSKRIPAGGTVTFEFRADQAGEVDFYSNLTNDPRHGAMRGKLVVRAR